MKQPTHTIPSREEILAVFRTAKGPLDAAHLASALEVKPAAQEVLGRRLNAMDEMGRKIQLDALAVAFVCTALTTFSYGFLETAGFPRLSAFMVWPIMGGVWCVATIIGTRRYQ